MRPLLAAFGATAILAGGLVAPAAAADDPLARYYDQTLAWQPCGANECATLIVPLEYADPGRGDITVAVERVPHTGATFQGSLVVNPGGPGGAGTDYASVVASAIAPPVAAQFDIVGFDPRGIGDSTPVDCLTPAQLARWLDTDPVPVTTADQRAFMKQAATIGQGCLRRTPDIARHMGTDSTVRDLDILRSALGEPKLNYLGMSYGTYLGTTYVETFPDRVGRVVLDGAVDPRVDIMTSSDQQAVAFDRAIVRFAKDCARRADCALRGSASKVLGTINSLLDRLKARPMATTTGRPLRLSEAMGVIINAMYDPARWPRLAWALNKADNGDGTPLQRISDAINERTGPQEFTGNFATAFFGVNCWDYPATPGRAVLARKAREWAARAKVPAIASFFAWTNAPCTTWFGHTPEPPAAASSTTTAPIVVVGTRHDPSTPYAWAVALAEQLPTARLLTYEGDGHTAYGGTSACINDALDAFLLSGTLPPAGTRCPLSAAGARPVA